MRSNTVLVVGHTNCGGAGVDLKAVIDGAPPPPLGCWLALLASLVGTLDLTNVPHSERMTRVVEACDSHYDMCDSRLFVVFLSWRCGLTDYHRVLPREIPYREFTVFHLYTLRAYTNAPDQEAGHPSGLRGYSDSSDNEGKRR